MVYQGKSNGGTFIWNGLDLRGNRVASGIYIAWMSAGDGFEPADTNHPEDRCGEISRR